MRDKDKMPGESSSLDGLVLWKRYLARVSICWKWERRRIIPRLKADFLDLIDSSLDAIKETISAFISIFLIVLCLPLVLWRCIFIPIKHGSKVEEKLTENDKREPDGKGEA